MIVDRMELFFFAAGLTSASSVNAFMLVTGVGSFHAGHARVPVMLTAVVIMPLGFCENIRTTVSGCAPAAGSFSVRVAVQERMVPSGRSWYVNFSLLSVKPLYANQVPADSESFTSKATLAFTGISSAAPVVSR